MKEIIEFIEVAMTGEPVPIQELLAVSGLPADELQVLIDFGVVAPLAEGERAGFFPGGAVLVVRRAARLRRDFDLSADSLALVMALLERIEATEAQLRELECQLLRGDV